MQKKSDKKTWIELCLFYIDGFFYITVLNTRRFRVCFVTAAILVSGYIVFQIQSNSYITNSLGPTIRYNWDDLCTRWSFGTENFVRHNRVFVITEFIITEFVITEFYCSSNVT